MESTDRDKARRKYHVRYGAWVLVVVMIVAGLGVILTSVGEISNFFWVGLLLFMLGSSWYGYDKGYDAGMYRGYEKGVAAQREAQKTED